MAKDRCLYCYKEISKEDLATAAGKRQFHPKCSKKFFGKTEPPELNITEKQLVKLAEKVVRSKHTVTGVQPKLSLGIERKNTETERLTIVRMPGSYILKPPTKKYPTLPEVEHLTMKLAETSKIKTVPNSLVYLKSGQLAYITKRVDRTKSGKVHMEDMCQLTERLTEHKYKGSHEQVAKAILKHASNPGLDIVNYYELVIFCFLTGNNDMHLKNFSLIKDPNYRLCPAYDLVASELLVEGDDEELALNLNGKKNKLKRSDFENAMKGAKMDSKAIENVFSKFEKEIPKWIPEIKSSFLTDDLKTEYVEMIINKAKQIEISKS